MRSLRKLNAEKDNEVFLRIPRGYIDHIRTFDTHTDLMKNLFFRMFYFSFIFSRLKQNLWLIVADINQKCEI